MFSTWKRFATTNTNLGNREGLFDVSWNNVSGGFGHIKFLVSSNLNKVGGVSLTMLESSHTNANTLTMVRLVMSNSSTVISEAYLEFTGGSFGDDFTVKQINSNGWELDSSFSDSTYDSGTQIRANSLTGSTYGIWGYDGNYFYIDSSGVLQSNNKLRPRGLRLSTNELIEMGSANIIYDGTDFVFSDNIKISNPNEDAILEFYSSAITNYRIGTDYTNDEFFIGVDGIGINDHLFKISQSGTASNITLGTFITPDVGDNVFTEVHIAGDLYVDRYSTFNFDVIFEEDIDLETNKVIRWNDAETITHNGTDFVFNDSIKTPMVRIDDISDTQLLMVNGTSNDNGFYVEVSTSYEPYTVLWSNTSSPSMYLETLNSHLEIKANFTTKDIEFNITGSGNGDFLFTGGDISAPNLSGTNTGDQDLSGYVPYSGATANLDMGDWSVLASGFTLTQDELLTIGSNTLTHDGTDFVFSDSVKTGGSAVPTQSSMSSGLVVNEEGNTTADGGDFRVESNLDTLTFKIDADNNLVEIHTGIIEQARIITSDTNGDSGSNQKDRNVLINASSNDVTYTLPTGVNGRKITVKNINSNSNVSYISASVDIEGSSSDILLGYKQAVTLLNDGSSWWII